MGKGHSMVSGEAVMTLESVRIENFKSIKEIKKLKLKPLTIFTGVNSSGKSNIMEAISFFGQVSRLMASKGQIHHEAIFFQGDQKRYPRPVEEYIMHKKDTRNTLTIEINLKTDQDVQKRIENIFGEDVEAKVLLSKNYVPIDIIGYSYSARKSDGLFVQKVLINMVPIIEVKASSSIRANIVISKDFNEFPSLASPLASPRNLFDGNVFRSNVTHPAFNMVSKVACEIINIIKEKTSRMFLISGERGRINPEQRLKERQAPIPTWVGYYSENIIEILSHCMVRETEKFEQIRKWASKFQLMDVTAGRTLTNTLESHFMDDTFKIRLNSTLSGLGSRQLLSLITQIFWSEPGDVIMIEEPEISLHPEAQVMLQELFADAIGGGRQIICSTHSPFTILALSKIIKNKLLTVDDIAIYEVRKEKQGTKPTKLNLNAKGFIEGGIPSFMKVELDLFKEWSESLESNSEET